MSTTQVNHQHAIHKDPHVIVTGELKDFFFALLVLESGVTHHGKAVIAQMTKANVTGLSGVTQGSSNGGIRISRATTSEPSIAKG